MCKISRRKTLFALRKRPILFGSVAAPTRLRFGIQFLRLGACSQPCVLAGSLLVATLIGCPNAACGAVIGSGFDRTLPKCGVITQTEPTFKHSQGDAVSLGEASETVAGPALAKAMNDGDSGTVAPVLPKISMPASIASYGSSHQVRTESLSLCLSDLSMDSSESRSQLDAVEAPTQNTSRQPRALDPRTLNIEPHKGIHWGSFLAQWWLDISFEQAERVIMEKKTRDQLDGRFFHEWFSDVAQYRYGLWNDGDRFFTSNIGHPLQGAVVQGIFWQNNDRVRFSEQDFHSAAYRKALVQAFAIAAVDAVQWKLGPLSEASIGHVGLPAHWWDTPYFCNLTHTYCHPRTGLDDLVMNEVGGTAMTIGFQWVDKHFQKPMENRIRSRAVIDTMRIFTNPPQSLANFFRFRTPWYRDNRN